MQTETKNCQNCKKDFTIKPDDFSFYEKIKVPAPTFCPDCRLQRRLSWVNERSLYFSNCDLCNNRMISMYPPNSIYKVYCADCYFSDKWDISKYNISLDFSKPFLKQFNELELSIPKVNLEFSINGKTECGQANHIFSSAKNIYLSYTMVRCEDCMYSRMGANGNKGCLDCLDFYGNERCYELVLSSESYESIYLTDSRACIHSLFLYECNNCTNCFMSAHLRNKSYVFRNKQLSRDDYLREMSQIKIDSFVVFENLKKEYKKMFLTTFKRYATIINSPNSLGDRIFDSKNIGNSFSVIDSENSKFVTFCAGGAISAYDITYTGKGEQVCELVVSGARNYNVLFSNHISKSLDVTYSDSCRRENNNLFGCIGLHKKQYCILNKQYTKEEYNDLIPKIIKHMNDMPYVDKKGRIYRYGEFFPIEFSPFAYNESLAYEEYPMTKQEAEEKGYTWRDIEEKKYEITIESDNLPDSIKDVSDDILDKIISCPNKGQVETKCTFGYKIMPEELRFYRLINIPLPRSCPNCRYYERRKFKNPWKLWHRQCMNKGCTNEFETPYNPKNSDIVYCESCYQKEVY